MLKKLLRDRHLSLASSRILIQAVRQVNGCEDNRYLFVNSPVIPASQHAAAGQTGRRAREKAR